MKRPNFFLIGAPKCGTTSLAAWLDEHPQVYMSKLKEPHHFNTDQAYVVTKSRRQYENLFNGVKERQVAIGEASVYYAYSSAAIEGVEKYSPGSKYVLCIRNPMSMVVSLHRQQVFTDYENITEFAEAWRTHQYRLANQLLPPRCPDPIHIDYKTTCSLGTLLEKLLTAIPRERLLISVLDDMANNPEREYLLICEYLGVDAYMPRSFKIQNKAKARKYQWLHNTLRILSEAKKSIGVTRSFGLLNVFVRLNTVEPVKVEIADDVMNDLRNTFYPEIDKLSAMLDRDFSSWKI